MKRKTANPNKKYKSRIKVAHIQIAPSPTDVYAERDIEIQSFTYPKKKVFIEDGYTTDENGKRVPFLKEIIVKDFQHPKVEVIRTIKEDERIRKGKPISIVHEDLGGNFQEMRIPIIKGIRQILQAAELKYGKGRLKKSRQDALDAKRKRQKEEDKKVKYNWLVKVYFKDGSFAGSMPFDNMTKKEVKKELRNYKVTAKAGKIKYFKLLK